MPVRKLKPDTPARRFMSVSTFEEITKDTPERKLTAALRKTGGRNHHGRITSRRRGGGHKRSYRIIDFKRNKFDIEASKSTIHRAMKEVGFSYITPRKNHYKQNKEEAANFKKKSTESNS